MWCQALTYPGKIASADGGWSGYRPVALLPPAVRDIALDSVYRIETVALSGLGDAVAVVEVLPYVEVVDPRSKSLTGVPGIDLQIETCLRQALLKCPVFDLYRHGSAVATSGGIYTCRHLFGNWLTLAGRLNDRRPTEIQPPLRLFRWDGSIAYDSAITGLRVVLFNDDPRLLGHMFPLRQGQEIKPSKLWSLFSQSELVKFTIDGWENVADQEAPTKSPAPVGKWSFAAGYPLATSVFGDDRDAPPGLTMVGSSGVITENVPKKGQLRGHMFTSGGLSGGGLFWKSGEAVGVACSGQDDEAEEGNLGAILDDAEALKRWRILKGIPF